MYGENHAICSFSESDHNYPDSSCNVRLMDLIFIKVNVSSVKGRKVSADRDVHSVEVSQTRLSDPLGVWPAHGASDTNPGKWFSSSIKTIIQVFD